VEDIMEIQNGKTPIKIGTLNTAVYFTGATPE